MILERNIGDIGDVGDIGNRRLRAECSPEHARRAAHVLDAFENLAAAGSPPGPGTQIRFGWSLLRLAEDGDVLFSGDSIEQVFDAAGRERWKPAL